MSESRSAVPLAPGRERFAWSMFDFANSGYTTVVLTTVFNTYFVGVVAGEYGTGVATLLWTIALAIANALVLVSGPPVGALADATAQKKRFLRYATVGCVVATAAMALVGPGAVVLGMLLLVVSNVCFASGENLIASFLPEIAPPEQMGRVSAQGWALGYVGGLTVLGICLAYVTFAQASGATADEFVPRVMLMVAALFALASLPTFLWLRERAQPAVADHSPRKAIRAALRRLLQTARHASLHTDLFRFLLAMGIYNCGVYTVIVLAAVYAQEAMGFGQTQIMLLILVVNVTAALGALAFGWLQDRIGSMTTVRLTLLLWIAAVVIAWAATDVSLFWLAANLVGLALGSSQSAGRAVVGQFTPVGRSAEFFGLWGLAIRASAIVGPLFYGGVSAWSDGNHRLALLVTGLFFVVGLLLTLSVSEQRGRAAAQAA